MVGVEGIGVGLSIPHNLSVDGARDAVLELQVHLGHGVIGEDGGIRDITCKRRHLELATGPFPNRKTVAKSWKTLAIRGFAHHSGSSG